MNISCFFGNYKLKIKQLWRLIYLATEKHLRLMGSSNVSWKDAINQTVLEASKTIDFITKIIVLEQTAKVTGNKITEYFVELDLSFMVDSDRK